MRPRIYSTLALVGALTLATAAFADVTGTQTLTSGQQFSFSSGTVVASGGDVQWTGSALNFVGSAKGFDIPGDEAAEYSAITLTVIQAESSAFTSAPISSGSLVVGNLFGVLANTGTYAKAVVTANSGGSLTFQFDYFGSGTSTGGGNTPTITAVLDAGSYTENIAEGSVFVVKGNNLSPAGIGTNGVFSTSYPLPQSSNGVSINFAPQTGGSATQAYIVYLYNAGGVNQLAAILPSTVKAGAYSVTVANGTSTSSPFSVTVVATKPGLVTQDSSGSGIAVVQNYISASELDINRFTTGSVNGSSISPAHPGETLIVWLTGMGPVPFADNTAPDGGQGYNFLSNGVTVQVYVGGTAITPFYAGRAPCCAGEDQIDFTLPNNIATNCVVPFQVVVNGNLSQSSFISIAPPGAAACVTQGFTTAQLQALDNGGTITSGGITISTSQESIPTLGNASIYQASASFEKYTGFELAGVAGNVPFSTNGTCTVIPITGSQIAQFAGSTGINLDAGALTLSGPSGSNLSNTAFSETSNTYSLSIGESGLPSTIAQGYGNGVLVPGAYTVKGAGGADVGQFTASTNLPTAFSVTGGLPTTVNRSSGLTLNWTGGNSSDIVEIFGLVESGTPKTGAEFICVTTNAPKTFTVPSSILGQLPAATAAAIQADTTTAELVMFDIQPGTAFTAPLTAGGNVSMTSFGATTIVEDSPAYQ